MMAIKGIVTMANNSTLRLQPHLYSRMVGELTHDARTYAGTDQLRERLSYTLANYVEPDHPHTRIKSASHQLCAINTAGLEAMQRKTLAVLEQYKDTGKYPTIEIDATLMAEMLHRLLTLREGEAGGQ